MLTTLAIVAHGALELVPALASLRLEWIEET
jgi:hypothetical protein